MLLRRSRAANLLVEIVLLVAVAAGLAMLIQTFLVKPYKIPTASMVPTLKVGQRVLVDRIGQKFGDPNVGDIVVFNPPTNAPDGDCSGPRKPGQVCAYPGKHRSDTNYIKRIVAGPGDRIRIFNGRVVRNGKIFKEPYIRQCGTGASCNYPEEITVPKDHYFMMGDNRAPMQSNDSRYWGPVHKDWIIGEAIMTFWPPDRIGGF
jgi:signal peptidase I